MFAKKENASESQSYQMQHKTTTQASSHQIGVEVKQPFQNSPKAHSGEGVVESQERAMKNPTAEVKFRTASLTT